MKVIIQLPALAPCHYGLKHPELQNKTNSFFPKLLLVIVFYQSKKKKNTALPRRLCILDDSQIWVQESHVQGSTLPAHIHFSKSQLQANLLVEFPFTETGRTLRCSSLETPNSSALNSSFRIPRILQLWSGSMVKWMWRHSCSWSDILRKV